MITLQDFKNTEIRVGTIVKVMDFPESINPSYKFRIDFGDEGFKYSSAQLANLYTKEQLVNTQIIAVINIKPKQIANFTSECLILGVVENETDISLIRPDKKVENGLRIL